MHVYLYGYTCIYDYMWRPEVNFRCLPQVAFNLLFETLSWSLGPGALVIWTDWPGCPRDLHLSFPSTVITSKANTPGFLGGCWGPDSVHHSYTAFQFTTECESVIIFLFGPLLVLWHRRLKPVFLVLGKHSARELHPQPLPEIIIIIIIIIIMCNIYMYMYACRCILQSS